MVLDSTDPDEKIGIEIAMNALTAPTFNIAFNAGVDGSDVVTKVKEGNAAYGYNAKTDEYTDLIEDNVIDPTKVTRCALENAASVASMFLTLEVAITDIPEKQLAA